MEKIIEFKEGEIMNIGRFEFQLLTLVGGGDDYRYLNFSDAKILRDCSVTVKLNSEESEDYDLPMDWEPNYNAPDAAERRHQQSEAKRLK